MHHLLSLRVESPLVVILNLFGNVAEMVNQKGVAKGGSWDHTLEESALTNDLTYSEGTG